MGKERAWTEQEGSECEFPFCHLVKLNLYTRDMAVLYMKAFSTTLTM